jgi:hypothetical protein
LIGQQPLVQFRGAGLGSVPLLGQVPHPCAELVRKGLEVFNAVPQQGYFGGICSDAFVGARLGARRVQKIAFLGYLIGGLGLVATLLYAGKISVPRRWAVHLPERVAQDRLGAIFATVAVLATAMIVVNYLARFARVR